MTSGAAMINKSVVRGAGTPNYSNAVKEHQQMYLYTSPLAYVYFVKHIPTGKFYYGSRYQNVRRNIRASDDLWVSYFTSSKDIKKIISQEGPGNFSVDILFESENFNECFILEQKLIKENIKDPLCLNKQFFENKLTVYRHYGKGLDLTEEVRQKCGSPWRGKSQPKDLVERRMKKLNSMERSIEWREKISKRISELNKNPTEKMKAKGKKIAEKNKEWKWITNGVENKRIHISNITSLNAGWRPGRTIA